MSTTKQKGSCRSREGDEEVGPSKSKVGNDDVAAVASETDVGCEGIASECELLTLSIMVFTYLCWR